MRFSSVDARRGVPSYCKQGPLPAEAYGKGDGGLSYNAKRAFCHERKV